MIDVRDGQHEGLDTIAFTYVVRSHARVRGMYLIVSAR